MPVAFTKAKREHIQREMLRRVSRGETATSAAKALGVHTDTVAEWRRHDADFAMAWRLARIEQAHALADQLLDIADEPVEKGDMAAVQRQRVRVDARKWFISKLAAKLYPDKLRLNVETEPLTRGVVILPALNWDQPVINACVAAESPNRRRFPILPRTRGGE